MTKPDQSSQTGKTAPTELKKSERARIIILLISTGLISVCAIVFELLIASLSTYLMGNSVYQFSITIGLYLSSMGLGSWLSQYVKENLLGKFAMIELFIGVIGGSSAIVLYSAFGEGESLVAYTPVMVLLTVVIGTGVGFEIPLIIRIVKQYATLRVSVANVLAADYMGSLLGSLAFPLVFLIYFGIVRTSLLVGTLNVAVAVTTTLIFRRHIRWSIPLIAVGVALGIGLTIAASRSTEISAKLEQRLFRDPIDTTGQSQYQRIVFTKGNVAAHQPTPKPIRTVMPRRRRNPFVEGEGDDFRLFLDGDLQFSSVDEYRYHEALVHPGMSAVTALRHELDILVLGGGDGLAAREVLRYRQVRSLTLVDLDSAVVNLANEYKPLHTLNENSLSDPRVNVIFGDAFTYLLKSKQLFDLIIVDLPDPDAPALSKLYSIAFYRIVERHLAEGGLLVTQSTSPYFMPRSFWCINHTLRASGLNPSPYAVYVPAFGLWGFNLAGRNAIDTNALSLAVENLNFLTNQVMRAMFALPLDIEELPMEANTLDRPVITNYYLQDEQNED
ncbi:MAG: spermidine synthase [Proteobacteria bacterium]|nr:spermidine synthase [Pseudomonadota bacterium]